MNLRRLLVLAVLFASATVYAAGEQFVMSKKGDVPVWVGPERTRNEVPLAQAGPTELLLRQDAKGDFIKVTTKGGVVGWVQKDLVQAYVPQVGQNLDLGEGKVQGYLDNPEAFYIITDDSKIPPEGFQVTRDLTAMVFEDNITREQLERKNNENF
jgi:hypothetical protein